MRVSWRLWSFSHLLIRSCNVVVLWLPISFVLGPVPLWPSQIGWWNPPWVLGVLPCSAQWGSVAYQSLPCPWFAYVWVSICRLAPPRLNFCWSVSLLVFDAFCYFHLGLQDVSQLLYACSERLLKFENNVDPGCHVGMAVGPLHHWRVCVVYKVHNMGINK